VGAIIGGTVLLWILSTVLRASLADSLFLANFNVLTVSVAAVFLIFTVSAGRERSRQLVRTPELAACPWRVLFYIGGAVALGQAMLSSGAVVYLASFLRPLLETESLWGLIAACLLVWFAANVFPNVAIHTFLPLFFSTIFTTFTEYTEDAAIAMVLVGSATLVLPISSTSNVILFSAGFVPIGKFIRVGLTMSLVVVPLVIGTPLLLGDLIKVYHPAEPHVHTLYGRPEQAEPEKPAEIQEDSAIRDDTAAKFPLPWHTKPADKPAKHEEDDILLLPDAEE
jgi:di/tricarboxylate transporter